MSDLKRLSKDELKRRRETCLNTIGKLKGKINNQEMRLKWINHYLMCKQLKHNWQIEAVRSIPSELVGIIAYIAMDENGDWYGYTDKPQISKLDQGEWGGVPSYCIPHTSELAKTEWKNSLIDLTMEPEK